MTTLPLPRRTPAHVSAGQRLSGSPFIPSADGCASRSHSRCNNISTGPASWLVRRRFWWCGGCWIRTNVGVTGDFTDRSLWPLGQPASPRPPGEGGVAKGRIARAAPAPAQAAPHRDGASGRRTHPAPGRVEAPGDGGRMARTVRPTEAEGGQRVVVRRGEQSRSAGGRQRTQPGGQGDRPALRLQGHRRVDRLERRRILMRANSEDRVKAVLDVFQTKLIKRGRLAEGARRRTSPSPPARSTGSRPGSRRA